MTERADLVPEILNEKVSLVTRSAVPALDNYLEYRKYLRIDFFYSCAYCTTTEAEARAFRFTIDHYEPQFNKNLVAQYSNLMYCCDTCNQRKTDLSPPAAARAAGYRFFRPDTDYYDDHFDVTYESKGFVVSGKTIIGKFSVERLDLNRAALLRIRKIRQELDECIRFTAFGISALRNFKIDQLPVNIRGTARSAIQGSLKLLDVLDQDLDAVLRHFAKSELIDDDPDAQMRSAGRSQHLRAMKALFPGEWNTPRPAKPTKKQGRNQ